MSKVYEYFRNRPMTQEAFDAYVCENGGAIIKTLRDEIFTDNRNVTMDTEETIVLHKPLCNGEFVDRVEINPTFIVSITYIEPRSKIVVAR
ncbi:MAG TPA: hypothetical protein PLP87_09005 [Clostridiales bacterium]|nr:hypothetical protein [Clostridiales bacterium]